MPQKTSLKNNLCFTLGRHPLLSAAEIAACLPREKSIWRPPYLILENIAIQDPAALIRQLGGTVKIGEEIRGSGEPRAKITAYLLTTFPAGKINFSVGGDLAKRDGLKIKSALSESGRSARFIEQKNTATIIYNRLLDKGADFTAINERVFVTRAVQPIEEWGERDYGRPARDDESGMLPPKLALIMLNLSKTPKEAALLDPFCGSGTILSEALILGYKNLTGADISEKAINGTKTNLDWVKKNPDCDIKLYTADIKDLNKKINAESIDAIVTEPYLGMPLKGRESLAELQKQAAELKQLYIEAFRQFRFALKPGGRVVIVIPFYI